MTGERPGLKVRAPAELHYWSWGVPSAAIEDDYREFLRVTANPAPENSIRKMLVSRRQFGGQPERGGLGLTAWLKMGVITAG